MTSFELAGLRISALPFRATLERVLAAREAGERLQVHFATAHTVVEADRDPKLRAALNRGLIAADGMPLVWVARRRGLPVGRVCGPDFMPALMDEGRKMGAKHYLYGGAPEVAERLAERMAARFPGLEVVGVCAPPFRELDAAEDRADLERINAAKPDFVWVGLGAPKQDLWIARYREALAAPALLAVGAAFDFHSGRRRRAPRWMQRSGLEWLHRLALEPRRLGGRYINANLAFLRIVMRDSLSRRGEPTHLGG